MPYGYFCPICEKDHRMTSRIGQAHYEAYLLDKERSDREANERRAKEVPLTQEEVNRRLYRAIFGGNE